MLKKTYDKVCELFEEEMVICRHVHCLTTKLRRFRFVRCCRKARLKKCLTVITGT